MAELDAIQQQLISNVDVYIRQIAALARVGDSYKLGDVYIIESASLYAERTSTGEPNKYQVVHISPMGMAFLRRLSSSGLPIGELILPPEAEHLKWGQISPIRANWRFLQDPDQLNAIMLQQKYDPMKQHNEKLQLQSEINKYNKSILIPTRLNDQKTYNAFLKNLKVGDKFWTSLEKQYVVHVPAEKRKNKWVIVTLNANQQQQEFALSYFSYRRLYKDKPRSFAEEVNK